MPCSIEKGGPKQVNKLPKVGAKSVEEKYLDPSFISMGDEKADDLFGVGFHKGAASFF